jgi:hypothetical protein
MALHTIRTLLRRFMFRAGPTLPLRAICTGLQTDTFGGGGWVLARIPLFTFVVFRFLLHRALLPPACATYVCYTLGWVTYGVPTACGRSPFGLFVAFVFRFLVLWLFFG